MKYFFSILFSIFLFAIFTITIFMCGGLRTYGLIGQEEKYSISDSIVMITIDGVRWQEIFNGTDKNFFKEKPIEAKNIFPNVYHYFVNKGTVVGNLTPMIASGPNHVSMPGYLEITRGHPSYDCQNNDCSHPVLDRSIFTYFKHPAVIASWGNLTKVLPDNVDANLNYIYRPDTYTEQAVRNYLENNKPDMLWVALGDADEMGHMNNYPGYIKSLQKSDMFIGELIKHSHNCKFIITTDHGRSNNFATHGMDMESERVWLGLYGKNILYKGFVKAHKIGLSNIFPTILELKTGIKEKESIQSNIIDNRRNFIWDN